MNQDYGYINHHLEQVYLYDAFMTNDKSFPIFILKFQENILIALDMIFEGKK